MSRTHTLVERMMLWDQAFDHVRRAITPPVERDVLATMDMLEGVRQLESYIRLAEAVHANDRVAAETAARLVWSVEAPSADDMYQWQLEAAEPEAADEPTE